MAIRWHHFDKLSTFATVSQWLGIPTLSGIVAASSALWTSYHTGGPLITGLVALAVFVTVLWSGIGLVWLWDRRKLGGRKIIDSAWGLVTEGYTIGFDPNNEGYCQISLNFKNVLSWPLRVELADLLLLIENRAPDLKMVNDQKTFILMPDIPMTLSFPPYSRNQFPVGGKISGKISFSCHYGHPDGPYTRTMKRWMSFGNFDIPKSPFALLPGIVTSKVPEFPVKVFLQVGPEKEDEDKPYRKQT